MGCRQARPVDVLFRVVRQPDGELWADAVAPGRGAWLCRDTPECLVAAVRRSAFERAFGAPIANGAGRRLEERLKGASEQRAADVRE